MPSLESRIAFAAKHFTSPDGLPWSLTGRQWVVDEMWLPLDGWKLWPEDKTKLCPSCSAKANTIVEDYHASDETRTKKHAELGCAGLRSEPILILIANLKRQTGKTMNVGAWCVTQAAMSDRQSIALLAGSEDQIKRLFDSNYKRPIENSKKLSQLFRVMGTRLVCDKRSSDIEILPTTITSVGDTRTGVVIDECRKVPADIGPALFATMLARGGWECPSRMRSHVRTHNGVEDPDAPKKCSVCGQETQPWFGKSMFLSSAGELKDSDADWYFDLKEFFLKHPHPNVHVFASQENLNPKSSQKVNSVLAEVFGSIEATRAAAGIESGNEFLRKGQPFMSAADVKRCVDDTLVNEESWSGNCVGFLDTSENVEKTSLVILGEEDGCSVPWDLLVEVRCDFWIPADLPGGIVDVGEVERHCTSILSTFSGLRAFHIDTRGSREWTEMQRRLSRSFPIAKRWVCNKGEDQDGWNILYRRMATRPRPRIRIQNIPEQSSEFAGLRWGPGREGQLVVHDKKRAKMHRDITESMACCCYLADMLSRRGGRIGMAELVRLRAERVKESAIERVRSTRRFNPVGGGFRGPESY